MDEDEVGNVQGQEVADNTSETPGQNPAWNDVLSVLPDSFHSVVTPHFQKWDQAAQSQIEKANARVKDFEPYAQFVDNGIDPTEVENGLRLMYEINQNPQAVYKALGEAYGLTPGQVQAAMEDDEEEEESPSQNFQDPRFDQLQQQYETLGQAFVQKHNQELQAQADSDLDRELSQAREKHGEFDEKFVLYQMDSNQLSVEDAVQAYQEHVNSILQKNPRPFAPNVMGTSSGGTGLPSQAIDPTKLNGKDTRALVEQMLRASAAEN